MKKKYHTFFYSFYLIKVCFEKQKIDIIILSLLTIIESLLPIFGILTLKNMINYLSDYNMIETYKLLLLYCSIILMSKFVVAIRYYYKNTFSLKITKDINLDILQICLGLNLSDYENAETYDQLKRALDETKRPSETFLLIVASLGGVITFFSYVTVLTIWKWFLLPLLLVIPIISFYFILRVGKYEFNIKQARTKESRKLNYLSSVLTNDIIYKENKILNICSNLYSNYKDKYNSFVKKDISIIRIQAYQQFIFRILESLIGCLVILMVINGAISENIKIGNVYAFITAIWGVISSADDIISNIALLTKNNLYIENLFIFLEKKEYKEKDMKGYDKKNKIIIYEIETIEFSSVNFRYKENLPYILKNISFKINKGEKIGIIGKNGSGKSTLIKLLSGFYDSYEGNIYINGHLLRDIDIDSYQKQISVVFQDFSRYLFTVKENLDLAIKDESNSSIIEFKLKQMEDNGLLKYVKKLPNGIDTQLGYMFENGIQLSGGEWQQLAIGRALMKNPKLFILDEPCSNVDLETEYKIYQYLKKISDQNICFLVSHRLHNIIHFADYVMIFQDGELIEYDSVDALLNSNSVLKKNFFNLETSNDYFCDKENSYGYTS